MSCKILDFVKYKKERDARLEWKDCHRCETEKIIPYDVVKDFGTLEKDCPKCGKTLAVW